MNWKRCQIPIWRRDSCVIHQKMKNLLETNICVFIYLIKFRSTKIYAMINYVWGKNKKRAKNRKKEPKHHTQHITRYHSNKHRGNITKKHFLLLNRFCSHFFRLYGWRALWAPRTLCVRCVWCGSIFKI